MSTGWGDGTWSEFTWGGSQSGIAGNSAVGAVGTVTASVEFPVPITGVNVSGAVGSVSMGTRTVALTGVVASGAVGDVVKTNSPTEDGVIAQGQVGTVNSVRAVALTGVNAVGAVGTVIPGVGPVEDSVVAFGQVGSIAATSRTIALSGVSAQGQAGTANYFYWTLIDDNQTPNWQNVPMTV